MAVYGVGAWFNILGLLDDDASGLLALAHSRLHAPHLFLHDCRLGQRKIACGGIV
jgi:hypothetical protein